MGNSKGLSSKELDDQRQKKKEDEEQKQLQEAAQAFDSLTVDELVLLLGQKEAELYRLRRNNQIMIQRLDQMQEELNSLKGE